MTIELTSGDMRLVLDPETGGAIAALTWRGGDLLRPVCDGRMGAQQGRAVAGYPLIPFANRVAGGRFSFAGQNYQLARNFGDDPNTIHGNAWMHPWRVTGFTSSEAKLALDFNPAGTLAQQWPFAYTAEQAFSLADNTLTVTLSVRNTDTRAFPAGIGLHPYVARTPTSALRFDADTFWTTSADGLPQIREAVHGAWDFAVGRPLGAEMIDTCFAGWSGQAVVSQPESGVEVALSSGPPMDHLQLYTPAGRDFIGLEPVSNMPDAINRMDDVADGGLVVLQPGDVLRAVVRIKATGTL